MISFIEIALILLLLLMFLQDTIQRALYVFWFPICVTLCATRTFINTDYITLLNTFFSNLLLLALVSFLVLLSKHLVEKKRREKLFIGAGDVLLYFSITPLLVLDEFVYLISLSLFLITFFSLPFLIWNPNYKIPLAGMQSLILAVYLVFDLVGYKFSITSIILNTL